MADFPREDDELFERIAKNVAGTDQNGQAGGGQAGAGAGGGNNGNGGAGANGNNNSGSGAGAATGGNGNTGNNNGTSGGVPDINGTKEGQGPTSPMNALGGNVNARNARTDAAKNHPRPAELRKELSDVKKVLFELLTNDQGFMLLAKMRSLLKQSAAGEEGTGENGDENGEKGSKGGDSGSRSGSKRKEGGGEMD